jgi:hypothetical protein
VLEKLSNFASRVSASYAAAITGKYDLPLDFTRFHQRKDYQNHQPVITGYNRFNILVSTPSVAVTTNSKGMSA